MRFIDLRKLKRALENDGLAMQRRHATPCAESSTRCSIPAPCSSRPHEGEVDDESRNLAKGYFELVSCIENRVSKGCWMA